MLLLNSGHLWDSMQSFEEATEMACCSDCGSDCCTPDNTKEDSKEPCNGEQDCIPGCDCAYQYQMTAITYSFLELSGEVVQSYHYGHYMNSYTFEYSKNFLQPPRFG